MSSAPTACQGPSTPTTTEEIDARLLRQAANTVSGTPFTSAFNFVVVFAAHFNSYILNWGWVAYQTALDQALHRLQKRLYFHQRPREFQKKTWMAAGDSKDDSNRQLFPKPWPLGSPFPKIVLMLGPAASVPSATPVATEPSTPVPMVEPEANEEMGLDPSVLHPHDPSWAYGEVTFQRPSTQVEPPPPLRRTPSSPSAPYPSSRHMIAT